jgi:hypothetical protein
MRKLDLQDAEGRAFSWVSLHEFEVERKPDSYREPGLRRKLLPSSDG